MKIALGADHGGYELKEKIKQYLAKKGKCRLSKIWAFSC